jgi:SAM-dependent methyltransferase
VSGGPGVSDALKQRVVSHYEEQLRRHGATAQGMDWKDESSQRLRFRLLAEVGGLAGATLHEVGCGAGHLADYLRDEQIGARYSGSDLSAEMIAAARQRHPDLEFTRRDVLEADPAERYDIVVCSGVFHVKLDHADSEWRDFVEKLVRRMYGMCERSIAFNLMTDQVDFRSPHLYYANPGEVLEFCRRELSRAVTIRHDYPLYEFTTYVRRLDSAD